MGRSRSFTLYSARCTRVNHKNSKRPGLLGTFCIKEPEEDEELELSDDGEADATLAEPFVPVIRRGMFVRQIGGESSIGAQQCEPLVPPDALVIADNTMTLQ